MKTFFIYSFGCKVNRFESQLIEQKLNEQGFVKTANLNEADIIIFNSCSVTNMADKECHYYIRKTLKLSHNPKIILTGCMSKTAGLNELYPSLEIVTDKTKLFSDPQKQTIKNFSGRSRAFLKIQDGCNSFCSYCIVPYIRNELWSKPCKVILDEICELNKKGFYEIVLTGIHIGKFKPSIVELLGEIVKIPLNFRVRLSSIDIGEIDENLINLLQQYPHKICDHLHIPLQSGSDKILRLMNRKYSALEFSKKLLDLKKRFPQICISSDIIVGFPGESDFDNQASLNFIKDHPFSRLHIFRYSDRNSTAASKFSDKVAPEKIKQRSKEFFEIDALKRKEFLKQNLNKESFAVCINGNKALTSNYICISNVEKQEGIFPVIINSQASI